jgi:hypothetical protein
MSVIYIQGGGGGGTTVQDATTTVKGIVRLATIQEAQGNYQDIAVTPAGVQQAIAGIVGGMIFKGSYDVALATPALEDAEQGDYYVVSNVKVNPTDTNVVFNRFGQEWAVGDHLVIKEDMGGTIDDAKILKVDNTEKVAYLNDLLDVTESLAATGHVLIHDGVDYKNRALTPADIVGLAQHLYALLDVSLGELSSAVYTTSTAALSVVHSRDYTIDIQGYADPTATPPTPYVKTINLPASLNDDHDEIRIVNIGQGALLLEVQGSAVFYDPTDPLLHNTTPVEVNAGVEVNLTGEVRTYTVPDPQDPQQTIQVNKTTWYVSQGAVPSRQSLVREGSGDWTNGFLTAADIVGVVTQGEREALQQELDRTQDAAGLDSDGTMAAFGGNYINGNTTLRQAIISLDSSLKSEETARISGDSSLQSQLNSEISARQNGDSNLQTQINNLATIATTGASADASVAHTAVAYTPSAANVEAHITEIDATLNTVLSTNVLSVNSETPTLGDVLLDGTHIDSTTTANHYTAAGASLDEHLDGIDTKLGSLQTDLNTEVSDRTSGDANLQSQITALATVASTGAAADVSVAHTATSYTPTSADVEAHIVGLDTQVNLLGSQIVTSVNAEAPVNGDVTLDGTHIDTLTAANNYTAAGAQIDQHLDGIDTKLGEHQTELDAIETGAGLDADGAYTANPSANYIASATSLKSADNALDTQLKSTQDELDATQTGAGLDASGTYTANASTNYLASATSLKSADELLDAQIALLSSTTVISVNGESPDLNGDVNVDGSEIDTLTTASNYTAAGASLDEHLDGIDTELGSIKTGAGLQGDGTYLANAGANYIASATSLKSADNALDTALDGVNTRLETVEDSAVYTITSGATTLSVSAGSNDLLMDADDIQSTVTAVNYTGAATDSVATQITNIDTALLRPTVTAGYQAASSDPLNTHLTNIDSAIALKATIDSPTFTTSADAPTPTAGDNSTSIATTAFVQTEIASLSVTSQGADGTIQTSDGASGFSGSNWKFDPTSGHLLPDSNDTYDIGSATQKVRDMYLGSNSLKFADDAATPNVISVGLTDNLHPLGENLVQMTDGVIPVVYRDLVDVGQGGNGYADIEDLTNPNMLAKVASTGKYTDLIDTPQSVIASSSFDTDDQTYQLEAGKHHTFFPATGATFDLVVPDSLVNTQTDGGDAIRITNWGNGTLKITTSGSSANTWIQYSQSLLQADTAQGATQPEVLIESRTTVDLYGWSYSSGGTTYDPAWGVYFAPSMEINTKSLTTSGQMLVYDATNDELVAGGLGDLSLTYAPTNYDNTLGGTVTGDKIEEHLEGVDNKLATIREATFYNYAINSIGPTLPQIADSRRQHYTINLVSPTNPITVPSGTSDAIGSVYSIFNADPTITATINCPSTKLLSGSTVTSYTVEPFECRTFVFIAGGSLQEITASRLDVLSDVDLTTTAPVSGDFLKYDGANWVPSVVTASVASIDDVGDVDTSTTAPSVDEVLKWDGSNWVNSANSLEDLSDVDLAYSGTLTDGRFLRYRSGANGWVWDYAITRYSTTVASTRAISYGHNQHVITGTNPSFTFTYTVASDVASRGGVLYVVNNSTNTHTLSVGTDTFSIPSGFGGGFLATGTDTVKALGPYSLGAVEDITLSATPSNGASLVYDDATSEWVDTELFSYQEFTATGTVAVPDYPSSVSVHLSGGGTGQVLTIPTMSTALNGTQIAIAHDAVENWYIATPNSQTTILRPNGRTGTILLESGQHLILQGMNDDTWVALSLDYNDLGDTRDVDLTTTAPVSGDFLKYDGTNWVPDTPTASVASIDDIGDVDTTTTAPQNGDILEWDGTNWVPVAQSGGSTAPTVDVSAPTGPVTLSTPTDIEEIYIYTPTTNVAVTLASATNCGQGFKYQIKNMSTNTLSITPAGSDTIDGTGSATPFDLTVQYSSVTLVCDGTSAWYII